MASVRVHLVVSCHVESGTVRDRTVVFDRTREEGVTRAVPRILAFAERQQFPIALNLTPQAFELCRADLEGFPLGLHLHPQDDVLAERLHGSVELTSDCLAYYSAPDQARLLDAAIDAFVDATGHRPILFVAGNWSENSDTVRLLESAGIRFDGSALPGYVSPCADWGRLPRLAQPYRPSREDPQRAGDSTVTTIPVFQGYWGDYLSPENLHYLGVRYFMAALREAAVGGAQVVHMYFHSPMALDPFFLQEFGKVLDFARDRIGAQFVPPESVIADPHVAPRPYPPAYLAYLDPQMVKSLFIRRFPAFAPGVRTERGLA